LDAPRVAVQRPAPPPRHATRGKFLPEHTAAISLLDRLLHHCHTIVTNGDSYRVKQARTRGTAAANKS